MNKTDPLAANDDVQQPSSGSCLWDMEPRGTLENLNNIRWIRSRCAEFFERFDGGGAVVFMDGSFMEAVKHLKLDLKLDLYISNYARKDLDETWARSPLREYECETMEDNLETRIKRQVTIRCADESLYIPSTENEVEQARPSGSEESQVDQIDDIGEILFYPNYPIFMNPPSWEDEVLDWLF